MLLANVAGEIVSRLCEDTTQAKTRYKELRKENARLVSQQTEIKKKIEILENEREGSKREKRNKWTQVDTVGDRDKKEKKEKWSQTEPGLLMKEVEIQTEDVSNVSTIKMDIDEVDTGKEQGQDPAVNKKLDEIIRRITKKKEKNGEKKSEEVSKPWTEVVSRNKKRTTRNLSLIKTGKGPPQKEAEDEERRKRYEAEKEKRATSLKILKRRIPRSAGDLIELQRGTQEEYEKIIKKCQKEISLKEMDIPPIGIKKARAGGILLEIRSEEREDEKAELLASKIKEVVRSVEGAQVRRPLRRG